MKARLLTRLSMAGAVLAIAGTTMTAQNTYPRLSVIEQFTSATCGPCVAAGPVMANVVKLRDGVVSVRYHMNFPAPGDPWNVYNPTDNGTRQSFYGVNSIPTARVNGKTVADPRTESSLRTPINTDKNAKSPAYITVTQEGSNVKVKVWSNIALNGHTLHVAILSRSTNIPGLSQTLANSNGEETFADALLQLMTGPQGQTVSIAANQPQEFTFTPSFGTKGTQLWPADQQYAVAFLQAPTTNEIIQAGVTRDASDTTSIGFLKRTALATTIDGSAFGKVARGASVTRTVTVKNNGNVASTAKMLVEGLDDLQQAGWSVSISPAEQSVAAGETKTFSVTVGAPAGRSVFSSFVPSLSASDGIGSAAGAFNLLVDGAKMAVYGGTASAASTQLPAVGMLSIPSYAPDVVYIPLSDEANAAYPATDFDGITMSFDVENVTLFRGLPLNIVKSMLAAGKRVWLNAELEAYANFDQSTSQVHNQDVIDFYTNTVGLNYLSAVGFINQQAGQLLQIPVQGVAGDPIGDGLSFVGHTVYSQQWPYYQQAGDLLDLKSTSKAKPVYTIRLSMQDGSQRDIPLAVRYENASGGKLFLTSLSMKPIADNTTRVNLTKRIMDWLYAGKAAEMTLSTDALGYGTVDVNASLDKSLTITNSGQANLEISAVTVGGSNGSMFTITSGAPTNQPIVVAPGARHTISVRYVPASKGSHTALMTIQSNTAERTVTMSGIGNDPTSVATDVTSETGALGLRLVGSNPVTTTSAVELTVRGSNDNVSLALVDNLGRTVKTMVNGAIGGTQRIAIDAAGVPAGTYSLVASNGADRAVLSIVIAQ